MSFVVLRLPCFEKQLQKSIKKHQNSLSHVNKVITSLSTNQQQGDVYPGFSPLSVRKIRVGLPEYKIGKRSGLRLLYLNIPTKEKIVPLAIYRKKLFSNEQDVKKRISEALKTLEKELLNKKNSVIPTKSQ